MEKIKRKVIMFMGTALTVTMLIGAGTYAYFSANVSNTNNKFQSGTIKLTGFRNDVPIEGPMFYNDTALGAMSTGYWKPGDAVTRGFFVQNKGSLDVKLKRLWAEPVGGVGVQDAVAQFADQADVTISLIKRGATGWPTEDRNGEIDTDQLQTKYAEAVAYLDKEYKKTYSARINSILASRGVTVAELTDAEKDAIYAEAQGEIKDWLLTETFQTQSYDGQTLAFSIEEVFQGTLDNLMNSQNTVLSQTNPNFVLNKNEGRYFGYTVTLRDEGPEVDNNLQGATINLNFKQDWVQE